MVYSGTAPAQRRLGADHPSGVGEAEGCELNYDLLLLTMTNALSFPLPMP